MLRHYEGGVSTIHIYVYMCAYHMYICAYISYSNGVLSSPIQTHVLRISFLLDSFSVIVQGTVECHGWLWHMVFVHWVHQCSPWGRSLRENIWLHNVYKQNTTVSHNTTTWTSNNFYINSFFSHSHYMWVCIPIAAVALPLKPRITSQLQLVVHANCYILVYIGNPCSDHLKVYGMMIKGWN